MKQKQKPLSFSLHPDNIAYIEAAVLKQKEVNSRYSRSMYMDDLITHLRTKAKPVKKAKAELSEVIYPENLNVGAWDLWVGFRKTAGFKKYKSDATMKKLAKMGDANEQFLIIQQSIDNEYQGLFALKGNNNGSTQKSSQKLSAHERVKQRNDAKYRAADECGLGLGADDGHMGRAVDEGERGATIEHVGNSTFVDY